MKFPRLSFALGTIALASISYRAGLAIPWAPSVGPAQDELTELLDTIEFIVLPDGNGDTVRTLRFSDVNLQIVSGQGATNGNPAAPNSTAAADVAVNGVGNLILGYHEPPGGGSGIRTGSHNVVIGSQHAYTSFGGLVSGRRNTLDGPYAAVAGGRANVASGEYAVVAGGRQNTASGPYATVAGGRGNEASGEYAGAFGGGSDVDGNIAIGDGAVVVGGRGGSASATHSVVAGGMGNAANSEAAVAAGGEDNVAEGVAASVFGGLGRTASAQHEVIADGGGDSAWTLSEVGGTTTATANADAVAVGTTSANATLEVRAPQGETTAAEFLGDLEVGRGSGAQGASEHIVFRADKESWYAGALNDESGFFVSPSEVDQTTFHLGPEGALGLGTDAPQAALHVRRPASASIRLEGGDPGKEEVTGLELVHGLVTGQVGFFGADGSLVFRLEPEDRPQPGISLHPDGRVLVEGGVLQAPGTTSLLGNLAATGMMGVGKDLNVSGNVTVGGSLTVEGDVLFEAGVEAAAWSNLAPIAWGHVDENANRISGTTNWSCEYQPNPGEYRFTLDETPAFPTLVLARNTGGASHFTGVDHPDDPGSNLSANQFSVGPYANGESYSLSFMVLEMRN